MLSKLLQISYPFVFFHDGGHIRTNRAHDIIANILQLKKLLEPRDQQGVVCSFAQQSVHHCLTMQLKLQFIQTIKTNKTNVCHFLAITVARGKKAKGCIFLSWSLNGPVWVPLGSCNARSSPGLQADAVLLLLQTSSGCTRHSPGFGRI